MPLRRPEHPMPANCAERVAGEALVRQLGDGDLVVAGQCVTDHLDGHEIDFVVALEGHGIACLEVEGGQVWHDGFQWVQARQGKDREIDPVRQVMVSMHARRRDQLVVCADPDFVRAVGGRELAARLGLPA